MVEGLGALKEEMQAYLATITFADAMIGRVLDTLEKSLYSDNTIIVLWSDNGFHQGEKKIFGKHTLWERTSNVPFVWAGKGIAKDTEIKASVSLIDTYPTLIDLCKLKKLKNLEGRSLANALQNPEVAVDRNVFLPDRDRGSYAMINKEWRFIHYQNGSEELYNLQTDPHEWNNLAEDSSYFSVIQEMKKSAPKQFASVATDEKDLKLVIEGDVFHWEKKD